MKGKSMHVVRIKLTRAFRDHVSWVYYSNMQVMKAQRRLENKNEMNRALGNCRTTPKTSDTGFSSGSYYIQTSENFPYETASYILDSHHFLPGKHPSVFLFPVSNPTSL